MIMIQTRRTDEKFLALFSVSHPFSEHLIKREDDQLRDKYDHNAFFYQGQPSEQEVRRALAYQKARGDGFLKLEGYAPLEKDFGLEREETLTMVLPNEVDPSAWKSAPNVTVGPPDPAQLEQNELRYYGPLYGEDFTVRNLCRLRQKLTYHGAYLDGKLAGSCYTYSYGGFTCMDGLLVDSEFRCRYVATTLLKAMALQARREGNTLYLHADPEDTPKDLYARMGFETVDRVYEYLCTDLSRLSLGEEQKPSYTEHDGSSI